MHLPHKLKNLFFLTNLLKLPKKLFEDRYREHWFIAFREKKVFHEKFDPKSFRIVSSLKNCFYADPFPIKFNGINYIFFEDFRLKNNKGVISYLALDECGNITQPKTALIKDYHLSYPFVFSWNNDIYMLPETAQNRTIELYKALDFPENWQLSKVLFRDVFAVDTTIFIYNNKFWLFTNMVTDNSRLNEELFLFYTDSLYGDWIPHPRNPVVSDICSARPAGKIFVHDGNIIRPGQDCSVRYGYAITLNHIEILSETEYKEKLITKISPDCLPNNLCIHTINSNEDIDVIDGRMFIKKFVWIDYITKNFKLLQFSRSLKPKFR